MPCLHFVNFVSFCSKFFSPFSLKPIRHEIWCHSLFEFDRLRPFLVNHRLCGGNRPIFGGVRVCSSLFEFDAVRPTSTGFALFHSSDFMHRPISFDLHPRNKCWSSWQSSIVSGIFAGLKLANLANLANFNRSRLVFRRAKFHPSHLLRSVLTPQNSVTSS